MTTTNILLGLIALGVCFPKLVDLYTIENELRSIDNTLRRIANSLDRKEDEHDSKF